METSSRCPFHKECLPKALLPHLLLQTFVVSCSLKAKVPSLLKLQIRSFPRVSLGLYKTKDKAGEGVAPYRKEFRDGNREAKNSRRKSLCFRTRLKFESWF